VLFAMGLSTCCSPPIKLITMCVHVVLPCLIDNPPNGTPAHDPPRARGSACTSQHLLPEAEATTRIAHPMIIGGRRAPTSQPTRATPPGPTAARVGCVRTNGVDGGPLNKQALPLLRWIAGCDESVLLCAKVRVRERRGGMDGACHPPTLSSVEDGPPLAHWAMPGVSLVSASQEAATAAAPAIQSRRSSDPKSLLMLMCALTASPGLRGRDLPLEG
jgi:hypothetical protein